MESHTLEEMCKIAIANNDGKELKRLIDLCDKLHKGIEDDEFSPADLPPDSVYEEMKKKYEEIMSKIHSKMISPKVEAKRYLLKDKKPLSDMYMAKDAIKKDSVVKITNQTIICMPKYDGVSCAIRFILNEETNKFEVNLAETRGTDTSYSHRNTDLTERMKHLLTTNTCSWFKSRFHKILSMQEIYSITIRGEVVLMNKSEAVPASYVAGKVNSKAKYLDTEEKIGFKMFEITKIMKKDGKSFIPIQEKVCKIINKIDPSIPFEIIELNDNFDENNNKLMSLFGKWNKDLESPIDGVVYSSLKWTYPQFKEQASGVGYGKYALKPRVSSSAKLLKIDYTLSKDGRINPIFIFEKININGKNYQRAKSTMTMVVNSIKNKNMGVGSVIDIVLCGGIPNVSNVIAKTSEKEMKVIDKCPICNEPVSISKTVGVNENGENEDNYIFKCININCPGIIGKVLTTFMKELEIRGFGEVTIMKILGQNRNQISSVFEEVDRKNGDGYLKKTILNCNVGNFICGLNLLTPTAAKANPQIGKILLHKVSEELNTVKEFINSKLSPLVEEIKKYLI